MNWKEDNALLWTGTMHIPSKLEPCFPRAVWAVCLNRAAFQKPVGSPPAGLNGTPNLAGTEQCASYVWYFPKELKQQAAIKGNLFKINLKNTKAHICLKWKKKKPTTKNKYPEVISFNKWETKSFSFSPDDRCFFFCPSLPGRSFREDSIVFSKHLDASEPAVLIWRKWWLKEFLLCLLCTTSFSRRAAPAPSLGSMSLSLVVVRP